MPLNGSFEEQATPGSCSKYTITFVHAPDPFYSELQNNGVLFMPVWAYTLAAHLPQDGRYESTLHDTRFQLIDSCPIADVYFYSGINQDFNELITTRNYLAKRFPEAKHVIGGPICWSFDQAGDINKLEVFDHIVIGDGEEIITDMVDGLQRNTLGEKIVRNRNRFPIKNARPMHRPLLDQTIGRYYGAVLEVSRGCPFLCEFCDIRVMPDNNRAHNKSIELIVEELDYLSKAGVNYFLIACDNFIGDPRWAEALVDAIIEWQTRTGFRPSMYTWLTINLYKFPALMKKLRIAGFDMLFIGIESFNSNSLLETAKVQNSAAGLVGAIRDIQSYGFFIVGGLIFGFDSDGEDCFDITLEGIRESGLLSGDPSLLTALPGTPLYRRMKMANRIREVRYGLGGYKYQTNIRYLIPREQMIEGFQRFVATLISGRYQYERLVTYFENLDRGNYIALRGKSYANPKEAFKTIINNRRTIVSGLERFARFASVPSNVFWFARAFFFVAKRTKIAGRFGHFAFWWALWTTIILKYQKISDEDFDIDHVEAGFHLGNVLPIGYTGSEDPDIPDVKTRAQQRFTIKALEKMVSDKEAVVGDAG